jgi:hypothetical protein
MEEVVKDEFTRININPPSESSGLIRRDNLTKMSSGPLLKDDAMLGDC